MNRRLLLILLAAAPLAMAGLRVDTPKEVSTAASNGTNCEATIQIQFPNGGELREVQLFNVSGTATVTVQRVSSDLLTTSLVTTVASAGTNTTTTLNTAETSKHFRCLDFLKATGSATNVTFGVRGVFIAYDPT